MFRFLVAYVIPLIIITLATALTVRSLMRSVTGSVTGATDSVRQGRRRTPRVHSRKKLAIVITVLSVMFSLAWITFYVLEIWAEVSIESFFVNDTLFHVYLYSHVPVFAMCCLNPVALYVLSSRFRNQLFRDCLCCCNHRRQHYMIASWRNSFTTASTFIHRRKWSQKQASTLSSQTKSATPSETTPVDINTNV